MLKVLKSAPYTVMEVEVGIPDNKPLEGEPSKWGAEEGTRLEDLELEVGIAWRGDFLLFWSACAPFWTLNVASSPRTYVVVFLIKLGVDLRCVEDWITACADGVECRAADCC